MKIGVYGGSFNPPHLGHFVAAVSGAKFLGLDRLFLIPAGIPPHKQLAADSPANEERLMLTRLMGEAVAQESKIATEVLDLELKREGKSYTVDTLRELHEQYPEDEL